MAMVAGDILAKKWAITNNSVFLGFAGIAYLGTALAFIFLLKKMKYIAMSAALFAAVVIPVTALVGVFYFHEILGIKDIIAIALITISILIS